MDFGKIPGKCDESHFDKEAKILYNRGLSRRLLLLLVDGDLFRKSFFSRGCSAPAARKTFLVSAFPAGQNFYKASGRLDCLFSNQCGGLLNRRLTKFNHLLGVVKANK